MSSLTYSTFTPNTLRHLLFPDVALLTKPQLQSEYQTILDVCQNIDDDKEAFSTDFILAALSYKQELKRALGLTLTKPRKMVN